MSTALPVIATNFSGPTAFLSAENSFPLAPARVLAGGFAEPAVLEIRTRMRYVFENPTEAKHRGQQARADMLRFSPDRVADIVIARLHAIGSLPRLQERLRQASNSKPYERSLL